MRSDGYSVNASLGPAQAEGGGHNVFMVGACQLVTARPIAKGEQLFLNYGRKDNNSFLLSYGHLDDRMVFGNPAHKVGADWSAW